MALIVNGITAPTGTELNTVKTNLTSLAMRQLRAKYSLVDMIVDEFTDTTGIDTSASNEDALVYDSGYFGCYGTHTTVTTFDINGVETRDGTIQTLTTSFPGASNRTIVIEAWGGRGGASSFSWTQTYNREDSLEENLVPIILVTDLFDELKLEKVKSSILALESVNKLRTIRIESI